jgi:hypothetical protein
LRVPVSSTPPIAVTCAARNSPIGRAQRSSRFEVPVAAMMAREVASATSGVRARSYGPL